MAEDFGLNPGGRESECVASRMAEDEQSIRGQHGGKVEVDVDDAGEVSLKFEEPAPASPPPAAKEPVA